MSSAFVDGTRLDRALCAKALRREPTSDDGCLFVQIALARDRLVGRWRPLGRRSRMRSVDLPYSEVASLIRWDGPLALAAGSPPATATPALLAATPAAGAPTYLGCTIYDAPYAWSVPANYAMPVDYTSLPVPADGLPIRIERLRQP